MGLSIAAHESAPTLIALCAGALALLSPPLALLALGLLGASALFTSQNVDFRPIALCGPVFAALLVGLSVSWAAAVGVMFAWRLFEDTRWSVAEAKRIALAANRPTEARFNSMLHAWASPIYGLALVAHTSPHLLAGLPLDLPRAPAAIPMLCGGIAFTAIVDWLVRRAADWRLGQLELAPTAHLLAHHVVFLVAFGCGLDVSAGIVMLTAWRLAHAAPVALPARALARVRT